VCQSRGFDFLILNAYKAASEKQKEEEEVVVAKDDDPDGHKAISVEDPLEQAAKLLQPFASRRHKLLDIWLVTYDVALRRSTFRSLSNRLY
jgi:hypothetical protein